MGKIGGNISAILQTKDNGGKNAIGESTHNWSDVTTLKGWLDLSSGDSKYVNFSAKIQESTHIFVCDFVDLLTLDVESQNARMVVKGKVYEILLIDNPMEMNEQLEIYLKYVGC